MGVDWMSLGIPSCMFLKSFQPSVALYFSDVPLGTYNVASMKTYSLNMGESDDSPLMAKGSSINDMTVVMFSQSPNATSPMLVTPLPIVTEVRLLHL